jgi:Xaa-Pro aminopeptidase
VTFDRHDFPDRYFPQDEYEERWKRVHGEMASRGYDHAIVWGRTAGSFERSMEIQWLSNFSSSHSGQWADAAGVDLWHANGFSSVILTRNGEPEVHGDEPAPRLNQLAVENYSYHKDPIAGAARRLRDLVGAGRVALVGSDCLPVKYGKELIDQTPDIEYVFDDDLIRVCREIKSPREQDCIREGAEVASSALYRLMDSLYCGKTGTEAAAEAAHEIVRRGGLFHRILMNWGDTAYTQTERAPLYGLSPDAPACGELVWGLIYGPIHQGYWHDPGRTIVAGRAPSSDQKQLLEDTYSILQAIIDYAKPGVPLAELAERAIARRREVVVGDERTRGQAEGKDEGWPYFAHGNGMVWEPPFLFFDPANHRPDEVLRKGHVMGIEAWLTRDGVGHADFEENLIVTENSVEVVTKTPVFWH